MMPHTNTPPLDPPFAIATAAVDRATTDRLSVLGYAALDTSLTATELDAGDLIVTASIDYWATALPELFAEMLRVAPDLARAIGDEIDGQLGDHQAAQLRRGR